jgi:transposase
MLRLEEQARVWLVLGKTDMRKSINGLSDLVANELKLDAMSGQYFVFCGRKRNTMKILYWLRHDKLRRGG